MWILRQRWEGCRHKPRRNVKGCQKHLKLGEKHGAVSPGSLQKPADTLILDLLS